MQYTTLGSSGLKISRIALGCMSFGDTSRGFNEWALDDTAAEPLFRQAVELGITFWDTANAYGYGTSEEIVGRAIRKYTRRDDVVLATKVFFKMHDGPGGSGLSRRAILEQLDDSLRRLDIDYVDRLTASTPRPPSRRRSRRFPTQCARARFATSVRPRCGHGSSRRCSTSRSFPAGRGRLDAEPAQPAATRPQADADAVQQVADKRGVSVAEVALAWVLNNPVVSAPIVGATKQHHLADAVAALDITLTDDEIAQLEQHYTPREPTGY